MNLSKYKINTVKGNIIEITLGTIRLRIELLDSVSSKSSLAVTALLLGRLLKLQLTD